MKKKNVLQMWMTSVCVWFSEKNFETEDQETYVLPRAKHLFPWRPFAHFLKDMVGRENFFHSSRFLHQNA